MKIIKVDSTGTYNIVKYVIPTFNGNLRWDMKPLSKVCNVGDYILLEDGKMYKRVKCSSKNKDGFVEATPEDSAIVLGAELGLSST